MDYNLTEIQRDILYWMVAEVRDGRLPESFTFSFLANGTFFSPHYKTVTPPPSGISRGSLSALAKAQLILVAFGDSNFINCTLLQKAYDAVDSRFTDQNGEINEVLLQKLLSHRDFYNREELETLAMKMGFDHEDVPGDSKNAYARQLVLYSKRHSTLRALLDAIFRKS